MKLRPFEIVSTFVPTAILFFYQYPIAFTFTKIVLEGNLHT